MHSELKKYSKKFAPLAITAAFFAMPLLSGCAAGVGTAWCDFSTNNVHNSKGTPSDMVAKSRATCSSAVHVSGYIEAYSQATRRPAKPIVRAHLRMAVNKPH